MRSGTRPGAGAGSWIRHSTGADRLLPQHLHRTARATTVISLLVLLPLAGVVAGRRLPTRLDEALLAGLSGIDGWPALALDVAARRIPPAMPMVAVALALWCWQTGLRRAAAFALTAPVVAALGTSVLKPLLGRPSASGEGWMFPSGHVTAVVSVAAVLAVLLLPGGVLRRRLGPTAVVAGWAAAATMPALTVVGTVVHQHHHATDALGALLVAVIAALVTAGAIDRWRVAAD